MLNKDFESMLQEVMANLNIHGHKDLADKIDQLSEADKNALIGLIYENLERNIYSWVSTWFEDNQN